MLKPEKWRASFDSDGKVLAFHKALRLIILGVCTFWEVFNLHKQLCAFCPLSTVCFLRKSRPLCS